MLERKLASEGDLICPENAPRCSNTWAAGASSDLLETVAVLQVQNQAVGTQVYFVLGLRHLGAKSIPPEKLIDLRKKKKELPVQRLLPGKQSAET